MGVLYIAPPLLVAELPEKVVPLNFASPLFKYTAPPSPFVALLPVKVFEPENLRVPESTRIAPPFGALLLSKLTLDSSTSTLLGRFRNSAPPYKTALLL